MYFAPAPVHLRQQEVQIHKMFVNQNQGTLRKELQQRKERGYGPRTGKPASHQANKHEKRPTAVELSEEDRPGPEHLRHTSRGLIAADSNHSAPNLISAALARTSRTSTTVQTAAEDAALGAASSSSTRTRSIGTRSAYDTPCVHSGWSRRYSSRSATHDGDVQRDTDSENAREEDIASEATDTHKGWTSRRSYGHAQRGSLARRDSNTLRSPRDKRSRGLRPMDSGSPRDSRPRRADTEVTRNSDPPSSVRSQTTGLAKRAFPLASEEEPQTISDTDAEGRGGDDGNKECYICSKPLQNTSQRQCGDCPIIICSACMINAHLMLPEHDFDSSTDSDRGHQNDPASEERESGAPTSIARRTPGREDERYLRRTFLETESVHIDQLYNATCFCELCEEEVRMWWECGICSFNLCEKCLRLHPTQHQLRPGRPIGELHAEDRGQDLGDTGSFNDSRPEMIEAEDDPAGDGDDEEWISEEEKGHIGHEPASTGRPQHKRHRSSLSPLQPAQGQLSGHSPVPLDFRGLQGSRREDGSDKDRSDSDTNGNKRPRHKRDILDFSLSDLSHDDGRRATRHKHIPFRLRWSQEEERKLIRLREKGYTHKHIAEELHRTKRSVESHWLKLMGDK